MTQDEKTQDTPREAGLSPQKKVDIEFAGLSDDIVFVKSPMWVDENYWTEGDLIHIRYPSGSKIVVRPEFGEFGWSFHIEAPIGTEVEYERAARND